jgi:NAD-dependent deacetylase
MKIHEAAIHITNAKRICVFTGAGISVESGIPPFRGSNGLWNQYDPIILDLEYYLKHHDISWPIIKKLFFDYFGKAKPNKAHQILAKWEEVGIVSDVITQNIDCLHQKAGNKNVYEFHGTSESFICTSCKKTYLLENLRLTESPPICKNKNCKGLLKPNFIFFGEGIPIIAYKKSILAAENAEVFIIIGTTGEIMPASQIPFLAKNNQSTIIEINTQTSNFTNRITDIFLKGKATQIFHQLDLEIKSLLTK